jgi:hypothetical protein
VQTRVKGTLIVRRHRRFFKVIILKGLGNNRYLFECRELESKESCTFEYEMLGLIEAMDNAVRAMKNPEDILLIDLDDEGKWKIVMKYEIDEIMRKR